jgi:hypothetical protein
MHVLFEEIDYCPTPIGAVSLRRRFELTLKREVYEIKLDDEFLMSSLFTASEEALAHLGLAALEGERLDVLVGGLGLGYTARAVLEHEKVAALAVVEMLEPVIQWHRKGLLPLGPQLMADPRCRFVQGDFFARSHPGAASTPSCSTSTTRPKPCWTNAAPASTSRTACVHWPPTSSRAASSACGPTTAPTLPSPIASPASLPRRGPKRSPSTTRCRADRSRRQSIWPAAVDSDARTGSG